MAPTSSPSPQPRPIHRLARGELDKPGELVGPGRARVRVRSCLAKLAVADTGDEAPRRAALARWLTDDRNVLTWRSIVNRVWASPLWRGLCDTPNDFGKMGGTPSHPELARLARRLVPRRGSRLAQGSAPADCHQRNIPQTVRPLRPVRRV